MLHLPSKLHHYVLDEPAPTPIYTLSLHDALPICDWPTAEACLAMGLFVSFAGMVTYKNAQDLRDVAEVLGDRKSTRLNSSHVSISYAVFCLKKKNRPTT